MVKKCLICFKEFGIKPSVMKIGRGKYCSRECYRLIVKTIICPICKTEFNVYMNGHKRIKYCSQECSSKNKKLKAQVIRNCTKCGKEMFFAKWEDRQFCSRECAGSSKRFTQIRYCILCKNQMSISLTGSVAYFIKRRFCSPHCRGIFNAHKRKGIPVSGFGEKHWNWQGGKGTERHKLMNQNKYILWRLGVFIRDDYTCQICGIRKTRLNADHIRSWAKYPNLRYDINNGRTLCYKCHYEITFGKSIPPNIHWG